MPTGGRPLGLGFGGEAGTMLVVPPSLQSAARRVVSAEQDPDGGSNIWYRSRDAAGQPLAV